MLSARWVVTIVTMISFTVHLVSCHLAFLFLLFHPRNRLNSSLCSAVVVSLSSSISLSFGKFVRYLNRIKSAAMCSVLNDIKNAMMIDVVKAIRIMGSVTLVTCLVI